MKSFCAIVIFLLYNIWLFFVGNIYALSCLVIISEIVLLSFWKTRSLGLQFKVALFIIFVFLCNLGFGSIENAVIISLRLLLALLATCILALALSPVEIAQGLAKLCSPLKLFHINTEQLELTITIAFTFLPILTHAAKQIQTALLLKGFRFNLWNLFTRPRVFLITYLENLFNYIETSETALILKGYGAET